LGFVSIIMSDLVPRPVRVPHGAWDSSHPGIVPTPPGDRVDLGERAGRGDGPGHPRCDSGYACTGWPEEEVYHDTGDADDYRIFCGSCSWRSRTEQCPPRAWVASEASEAEPPAVPGRYRPPPYKKRKMETGRYRPPPYKKRKMKMKIEEKEEQKEPWEEQKESWSLEEEEWVLEESQEKEPGGPGVSVATSSGFWEGSQALSSSSASAGAATATVLLAIKDRAVSETEQQEGEEEEGWGDEEQEEEDPPGWDDEGQQEEEQPEQEEEGWGDEAQQAGAGAGAGAGAAVVVRHVPIPHNVFCCFYARKNSCIHHRRKGFCIFNHIQNSQLNHTHECDRFWKRGECNHWDAGHHGPS
jgi:hypothetical protein